MKSVYLWLSINKGEFDQLTILLDDKAASKVEEIYHEQSKKDDFDNDLFWTNLKASHPELADAIIQSIITEIADHYIFEDDFWCGVDDYPECYFPLCDLHFDYLTADRKITIRGPECKRCVIYDDNEYDCDFSMSFDSEESS